MADEQTPTGDDFLERLSAHNQAAYIKRVQEKLRAGKPLTHAEMIAVRRARGEKIDPVEERDAAASRLRAKRESAKEVVLPDCPDFTIRKRRERSDVTWLRYYFGPESNVRDPFTYKFTEQQSRMIKAFGEAIRFGGDQAIAASRGEGKTTILERLLVKYTLQGILTYSVLFQSTGTLADNSLDTIKTAFEENNLLRLWYPHACIPVVALENTPNRAHYQTVTGTREDNGKEFKQTPSKFTWCGQEIILPNVPGTRCAGAIIATRGLDAAVRGLKKKGRRPQLAAIDDPDTEDTARSEEQAKKLEERIDKAIGGLGDQTKPIARILLSTCQSRISVSYRFTDSNEKPTWKGVRFRYLLKPPQDADLWDEYVALRQMEFQAYATGESDDPHARKSHAFYLKNRKAMDRGAQVANRNRFDGTKLPDGSLVEVSALQHYFNEVARLGAEAVATEYDNNPPEDEGPIESGITAGKIQHALSGYPRRVVPPECEVVTQGIDVGKYGLYWVVKAWRRDATNYVIDYGYYETQGVTYGSDEGVEIAIRRAIIGRMEQAKENACHRVDGEIVDIALTLVDSGWQTTAVYQACRDVGLGLYAAKGHGQSHGCATLNFNDVFNRTIDRKPGDGWFLQRQRSERQWVVHCDSDRWKAFEHARWMTGDGKPGAAYLFGKMSETERKLIGRRLPKDSKGHMSFAKHLTAEVEVEDVVRGKLKRFWEMKTGRGQNHYLDASYLADVSASMLGVRLLGETNQAAIASAMAAQSQTSRPTLQQMAGAT